MRAGFVTCVELGLACMEEIYAAGGTLDFVMTIPDEKAPNKSGRVYVDEFAVKNRIPVIKVNNVNDQNAVDAIRHAKIDWLFIIGWSQIARHDVLTAPIRGVLGMHPTLLPEGRGRASIPWAIIKGLRETGVTLFQLDEGVDTGPIVAQERIEIHEDETATTLYSRVAGTHRTLMRRAWTGLVDGTLEPQPQTGNATVWVGRTPADGLIDKAMSVQQVERLVRATTRPYPGAFVDAGDSIVRVWAGRSENGMLAASGEYSIQLSDGVYVATEFEATRKPAEL